MVPVHYSLDDFYIVSSAGLPNQYPYSFPYILGQCLE